MKVFSKLILVLGVNILFGAGCAYAPAVESPEQTSSTVSSLAVVGTVRADIIQVRKKAKPAGVHTDRLPLKSEEIVNQVKTALEKNNDFLLLKKHFMGLWYTYAPEAANYIAATDFDGKPLVGFSYRVLSADYKSSALLVSYYKLGLQNFDQTLPAYTYLEIYEVPTGIITIIWADGNQLFSAQKEIGF